MENISEEKAISILRKYAHDETSYKKVLAHVNTVKKVALEIAAGVPGVDMNIIRTGSILHDIGRLITGPGKQGIRHGIVGGEILLREGLPKHARIAENHIGAGILKEDIIAQKLPLPHKDFVPQTTEEKIICHADNLVFYDRVGTVDEAIQRYRKELGEKYAQRIAALAREVESLSHA